MRPPAIPLEKITALPLALRMTIPESYRDANGHMNMRWYLAIFDDAGEALHERLGLTADYHRAHGTGTFDLEHHIHFLSEVMPRDSVAVYMRLVAQSAKRLHYLLFLANESRGRLSSIFECMNSFADLRARRTAPFPAEIAERIEAGITADSGLDWPPPVCGAMQV
jgi:acyl-CoA thioester hydrolase